MNKIKLLLLLIILVAMNVLMKAQNGPKLNHLSSYTTDSEGSAEVVAFDKATARAFFTSSSHNSFSIIDIADPLNPTLIKEVPLDALGGGPNSIAVYNGMVAVAIQNVDKTENGVVAIYEADGTFVKSYEAGALPDMLTFNHDGTKILVANEGEPNDDYSVDPLGSITIIDVVAGTSKNYDFSAYNSKKANLLNKGIRIFGNNGMSSVAQDMEPEFITVTPDNKLAYINCQENNGVAVFDLVTNKILDILPYGYKNHLSGTPNVSSYKLNEVISNWPSLGAPDYDGGQADIKLGGFSGLFYAEAESTENLSVFYAIPDRGPNAEPVLMNTVTPAAAGDLRPYKLPDYQARIAKFTLNHTTGAMSLDDQILLTRGDGITPISGKGNVPGFDEVPVTYTDTNTAYKTVDFVDANGEKYTQLPYDEMGGDFEGIIIDKEGNFWMCDENRPALYKFDATGKMIDRFVPAGTSLLGTSPQAVGTYGTESLPEVYSLRRANRGFEGIAYDSVKNVVYAFIQSPIENRNASVRNKSDIIRILGVDASNGEPVEEYVYLLERNKEAGYGASRVDKIGDAFYSGNGKFLVLERDSEGPENPLGKKYVFEIDIKFATNILNDTLFAGGIYLEEMSADDLETKNIKPVKKLKVLNLPSVGYASSDKSEGVSLLPGNRIAVINDNDFGLAGAGITDNTVLGIISFEEDYGIDASDKDSGIKIKAQPTLGMYLPDGISSYEVNGKVYIVTVNEGDSRDYAGYSEEVRVKDLLLDATAYPDAADLQKDANLGRLKTTTANGDYDGDGDVDQIYSFGGRSFSIFDQYGNLVYDSGNQFASIVMEKEADLFNEDAGKKDGRSDDKGVEPEAVAIGQIGDYTYAFIGCERQSSILVYDITDPFAPKFITYYNNRSVSGGVVSGDVAPEIIKFIPASESPNNENLLLVGYEVSGSMGIIQLSGNVTGVSEQVKNATFKVYPNPVIGDQDVIFDQEISGNMYNMEGKLIQKFQNASRLSLSNLENGIYILSTNLGTQRIVKM